MREHKPLPWKIVIDPAYPDEIQGIADANSRWVVTTDNGFYPPGAPEAAFIVKAVNERASLLFLCKEALRGASLDACESDGGQTFREALEIAITEAEKP